MKPPAGRVVFLVVAVVLSVVYGARALRGAVAGYAFARGRFEVASDPSGKGVAYFDASGVGFNRFLANENAARTRLRLWKKAEETDGPVAAGWNLLDEAAQDYVVALCAAPASPTPWRGLGEVYERRERILRAASYAEGERRDWSELGRPGRVAVGMMRRGIDRAENWYLFYGELAKLAWRFGLEDEATRMAGRSAAVLPMLGRHHYGPGDEMPRPLLDAFAEASWKAVDKVPLLPRRDHLVDLGKIELRRGRPGAALRALEAAAGEPADDLGQAEVEYYLGAALAKLDRMEEAASRFEAAAAHPDLRKQSLESLARIAEQSGRLERALQYLRDLRWDDSDDLRYCLEYARLARRLQLWDKAVEALSWARINHPRDRRPVAELAQTYLEWGEVGMAASLLREIDVEMMDDEEEAEDPQVERLRRSLQEALPTAPEL